MPAVLDVREAYHRDDASEAVLHVPLGQLLADPARVPADRAWRVLAIDARQQSWVARFLREQGREVEQ